MIENQVKDQDENVENNNRCTDNHRGHMSIRWWSFVTEEKEVKTKKNDAKQSHCRREIEENFENRL